MNELNTRSSGAINILCNSHVNLSHTQKKIKKNIVKGFGVKEISSSCLAAEFYVNDTFCLHSVPLKTATKWKNRSLVFYTSFTIRFSVRKKRAMCEVQWGKIAPRAISINLTSTTFMTRCVKQLINSCAKKGITEDFPLLNCCEFLLPSTAEFRLST